MVPRSRRNPQFDRASMPAELARSGIDYLHEAVLGGLRNPQRDSVNTGWRNAGFRGYADHMQKPEFALRIEALRELGAEVKEAHSGKVHVVLNGHSANFSHAQHDLPKDEVVQIRKFIETCGVDPDRDYPV